MADTPGPQTVGILLKEVNALGKTDTIEMVHLELDLPLNLGQREVYNIIIRYTMNDTALRTRLLGLYLAFGAAVAMKELRKTFPRTTFALSKISLSK